MSARRKVPAKPAVKPAAIPAAKSAAGRKPAGIDLVELEKLCMLQCTDADIASWFNVSAKTIQRRRKSPKFVEVMDRGYAKGRVSVRRHQMRILESGGRGACTMAIWLGKQLLGQRDQVDHEHKGEVGLKFEGSLGDLLATYRQLTGEGDSAPEDGAGGD